MISVGSSSRYTYDSARQKRIPNTHKSGDDEAEGDDEDEVEGQPGELEPEVPHAHDVEVLTKLQFFLC